jgi:iron complex transport system ATP-binding protein
MQTLTVDNLSVYVDETPLVDGVSLELNQGEVLAVIGSNGAGKTTLIETIAGEIKEEHPNYKVAGNITFNNWSIKQWQPRDKAKHLAYLAQLSALNFPFTVEEVIELGRIPHSTGVAVDKRITEEVLSLLDIAHLQTRLYTQLSGGEKQRVQIARVMSQVWREEDAENRLLILDEPTSSLDLGHQQQLISVINDFARSGVAIILVVHDVNLVSRFADQILGLCCGRVITSGKPEAVITPENMKSLYQVDVNVITHPETKKPIVV